MKNTIRNTKRRNTKRRNTKRINTKRRNTKRRNTKRRNTKRRKKNQIKQRRAGMFRWCCPPPPRTPVPVEDGPLDVSLELEPEPEPEPETEYLDTSMQVDLLGETQSTSLLNKYFNQHDGGYKLKENDAGKLDKIHLISCHGTLDKNYTVIPKGLTLYLVVKAGNKFVVEGRGTAAAEPRPRGARW